MSVSVAVVVVVVVVVVFQVTQVTLANLGLLVIPLDGIQGDGYAKPSSDTLSCNTVRTYTCYIF